MTKQPSISSVIIEANYSIQGKDTVYTLSKSDELSISVKSLSNIRRLSNLPAIKSVDEYYAHMTNDLNISGTFNYSQLIGSKKTSEYLNYLKKLIDESLILVTSYHTSLFSKRKACYMNLKQVKLNGEILQLPVYDHSGVTGRTSIVSGFNFLTMKKINRKNLKPLVEDKALVEVDFKSCEPFFFLKSRNFKIKGDDVYAWLCNNYNIELKDRDKVKRGILSMMYGANENTTSRIMRLNINIIKKIKEDLGLTELKESLEKEYLEKGFILNYYGRPITSDKNLVNYYIQSSAVDFCSLAFYNFIQINKVDACFFIHDSLTFQCDRHQIDNILKIKEIKEVHSNISIPVEFNVISA
mgnify:CR=1 FL=1